MPHHSPFENSEFVEFFSKIRSPVASGVARKVVNLAHMRDGQSLLDLGCGPGLVTKEIMKIRSLGRVLLLDRSGEMVRQARLNLGQTKQDYAVRKVDLDSGDLARKRALKGFDHAIAIDLWHLLERPSDVASFLFENALRPSGRLTISLHKQVSEKNMEVWHIVRQEIRGQIASMLKERYPKVEFEGRSKGAVVHEHDTESFRSDLESVGFKLVASAEDKRLADVNQLVKHLPESFRMEVRQKIPDIDQDLLESVVADSVAHVTKSHRGIERITLATEAFFVFAKPA